MIDPAGGAPGSSYSIRPRGIRVVVFDPAEGHRVVVVDPAEGTRVVVVDPAEGTRVVVVDPAEGTRVVVVEPAAPGLGIFVCCRQQPICVAQ